MVPRSRWATLACLEPISNNLLNAIHESPILCQQNVGHCLLPPNLVFNLNQRGCQVLSTGLPPAAELGRKTFASLHVFPFHVLIHKVLFGPTHVQLRLNGTGDGGARHKMSIQSCVSVQCRGRSSTRPGTGGRVGTSTSSTTSCRRAKSWGRPWRACRAVSGRRPLQPRTEMNYRPFLQMKLDQAADITTPH